MGQADTGDDKRKQADAPKDGVGADAGEKQQSLANQAEDLRRSPGEWKSALAQGNDASAVKAMGFPDAKVEDRLEKSTDVQKSVDDGPTFIRIAGIKTKEASVGEFIKIDVKPAEIKTTSEQSVMQIAAQHLGPTATADQIKQHAKEIYTLNFTKLAKNDSQETATFGPGETVRLQGHTADGAVLLTDTGKSIYKITEDGRVRTTRPDGSGFERSFTGKSDDSYKEEHFGPKASDKFTVVRSADGRLISSDKPEPAAPKSLAEEKLALERLIKEKVVLPHEGEKLKRDMQTFEARAKRDGVSSEEVSRTYRDLAQVLELKGNIPLSQRERVRLVNGAMANAAEPTSNDQGQYKTCQIATIENRLYAKEPSTVTDVLLQVARDGRFTTKDGTSVTMEETNLRAHGDAAMNTKGSSPMRTYTSQIFQTAAISAFYSQDNLRRMPPGDVHYYQKQASGPNDSGESLIEYGHGKPQELDAGPGMAGYMNNMIRINEQLTKKWQPELFIINQTMQERDSEHNLATGVTSVEDFAEKLKTLRESEKGPLFATLFVRTNSDPLIGTLRYNPLTGPLIAEKIVADHHVVNIVDYDPKTRLVKVDGQWGNSRDFITKPMTIEQAYAATLPPSGETWMARAETLKKTAAPKEFDAQLGNLANTLASSWANDLQMGIKVDTADVNKTLAAYERLRAGRPEQAYKEADLSLRILRNELSLAQERK
ncbi:MAG: hypothetical protein WCT03_08720 [Candidatus Obscuribacterales bacterium]